MEVKADRPVKLVVRGNTGRNWWNLVKESNRREITGWLMRCNVGTTLLGKIQFK